MNDPDSQVAVRAPLSSEYLEALVNLRVDVTPREREPVRAPPGWTRRVCQMFWSHCPSCPLPFHTAQAKPPAGFHSDGLIGRDARTTSAPGRACSAAPVDSGGATRRL
jgi:hypothetical protein